MKSLAKAALFGAVLATAVFFVPFVLPVLLLVLIWRALSGHRWRHAHAAAGARCAGPGWDETQRPPTIDGRHWQRPSPADAQGRNVQID